MALIDRRFDFVRVNRAYVAADQREPSDFIGTNHFALFPGEQAEAGAE